MKQQLAHKWIYPTDDQKVSLSKTFGYKRVIYNYYLNKKQRKNENEKKLLSCYDIKEDTTKLKETSEWLREVNSIALLVGRIYHRIYEWYSNSKACSSCGCKLEKLYLEANDADNILRVGQIDSYREAVKSQVTGDSESKITTSLQKMTSDHGSELAIRSSVAR